ncbi:MAG: MmgE/PrpD family protein, partial [Rhizobiales bacterium]|nr:MmgE/PrpD family protein [Hyphomicrobiales bacterium]
MTAAQDIANWAVTADFAECTSARKTVVCSVVDTIGCFHAGWRDPVAQKTLSAARSWGSGNAAVFGTNERLAPLPAAFVNGVSAHALDYDDCET